MLPSQPRTVEVDGRALPVANLVRRVSALAVDLCVAVLAAMAVMWLASLRIPLDSGEARIPIVGIIIAVGIYLVWARDHVLPSLGRRVFALRLVQVGAGTAGALLRPITVYEEGTPREEGTRTAVGVVAVVLAALASIFLFGHAMRTTSVFQTAVAFAERSAPFAGEHGVAPVMATAPRSVLIGSRHAYVQADASWGSRAGTIDFFLARERNHDPWVVREVRQAESRGYGKFGLKVRDEEVPRPE